jgi:hypothetical protein
MVLLRYAQGGFCKVETESLYTMQNQFSLHLLTLVVSNHQRKKVKGKAVPLQAWSGPEGSKKLRFSDYMTTAQDGGKVRG